MNLVNLKYLYSFNRGNTRINVVVLIQLYDRISTRVPTPCRAPQTDAVQRAREVEELLREIEHSAIRNIDRADLRELHELLVQPHMRVSLQVIYLNAIIRFWREMNITYKIYKTILLYNIVVMNQRFETIIWLKFISATYMYILII